MLNKLCCSFRFVVCLSSLLIFPCTIESRSSLLAPAHLGVVPERAIKRCGVVWWLSSQTVTHIDTDDIAVDICLQKRGSANDGLKHLIHVALILACYSSY